MATTIIQSSAKRLFYKWHRLLGIISLIPVICWTISGLSHPFMSNWFRPFIPQEVFKPLNQKDMAAKLTLQQVMDLNHITELRNFTLVNFNKHTYYQLLNRDSSYTYYAADKGDSLKNGDQQYAVFLARYFTQDSVSKIKSIKRQKYFDGCYQPINRLLPVWKISFDRSDGMDIYIETSQSRLATFNNNTRKAFLWIFSNFHNWQIIADCFGENFRLYFMLTMVCLMLLSLASGIIVYGLFWKRFKQISQKRNGSKKPDKRFIHRFHRQLGLIVTLVMFTFGFSGAFHLWVKLQNHRPASKTFEQTIQRSNLIINYRQLPLADSLIKRIGLVNFNNRTYYQVLNQTNELLYFNSANGQLLTNGDSRFAAYLGRRFGADKSHPITTEAIKQFTAEYGFINKRLPVVKISYLDKEDWYIETSSAHLATKVAGIDRTEGFSFIFLHKYFGMTWAGKDLRDIISMLAAAGVLVVSLFGFAAFIKNN